MKQASCVVAAAMFATMAAPVQAKDQALLDCAVGSFGGTYRAQFFDSAIDPNRSGEHSRLASQLGTEVNRCAKANGLASSLWPAYFEYSQNRLELDELAARLNRAGVRPQIIDDALDFGPGRANPVIAGSLTDHQIDVIYTAVVRSGLDTDAFPKGTWGYIGAYAQASSGMWNAAAKLR